jgi:hypothetical protein
VLVSKTLPCGPDNPFARGRHEDSRYVESMMEHRFLSDVIQYCWFRQNRRVEVMRAEVDGGGYDLVLEAGRRIRHVQLKSRWQKGRRRSLQINSRLRDHRKPCVVWIFWQVDPMTCEVDLQYRYSEPSKWPVRSEGETTFTLKRDAFLPSEDGRYLDIASLIGRLL